ncbi:GNAT family N-acetyltransferase [Extibacter muris]|uniref:GNAT family N-acetyltransferase n=1 Tax=Extibacter muris TaxID=1796622 RepID=UPI001D086CD8|nr:GNAT family N-acetyltransferase [Extibacter muris]MCB6203029.1 GNAT family N-acetyltransferase [Extibacter muris]MCQ4665822.1 GNAT family N-acetyltransferase [Extibacter muris]MCQ4695376.1 GNAT family N-acetyltransferase [Extibacter muris]
MIQIKDIKEEQIPAIVELVGRCGPYVQPHPDYYYWLFSHYGSAYTLYAEEDGCIIGFVSSFPMNCRENEIFVIQICVDNQHRGQGIGEKLLDTLYQRHQSGGRCVLECTISPKNLASQRTFRKLAAKYNGSWEWKETLFDGEIREQVFRVDIGNP